MRTAAQTCGKSQGHKSTGPGLYLFNSGTQFKLKTSLEFVTSLVEKSRYLLGIEKYTTMSCVFDHHKAGLKVMFGQFHSTSTTENRYA